MKCDLIKLGKFDLTIKQWAAKSPNDVTGLLKEAARILDQDVVTEKDLLEAYAIPGKTKIYNILKTILSPNNINIEEPKLNLDKNNTVPELTSSIIPELFHNMHILQFHFDQEVNKYLGKAVYLNADDADVYVGSDYVVNRNIELLKNELFKLIVDFLVKEGKVLKKDFYDINDNFTANLYINGTFNRLVYQTHYTSVLTKLFEHLVDIGGAIEFGEKGSKRVPRINEAITENKPKIDAYIAAVFLSNFDDAVRKVYSNILSVGSFTTFNMFQAPIGALKYKFNPSGTKTPYWIDDSQESESSEKGADSFTEQIISMIPRLNKKKEEVNEYLSLKDFYGLAASLSEFQTLNLKELSKDPDWVLLSEHPSKALIYYMAKIKEAHKHNFEEDYAPYVEFKGVLGTIYSIEAFFEKLKIKEQGTKVIDENGVISYNPPKVSMYDIISQPLNNSFGATYAIYNPTDGTVTYKELYSHNSTLIESQNKVYTKLSMSNDRRELYNIEEIKELKSDLDFSRYIYKRYGLHIAPDNILDLKNLIFKRYLYRYEGKPEKEIYNAKTETLRAYLENIVNILTNEENNIFDKISAREEAISQSQGKESDTPTSAILDLLTTMQDLLEVYSDSYVQVPITTIQTTSGERIPTYKLSNLTYNDSEVLLRRIKFEKENNENTAYRNLYTAYEDTPVLLGTTTKLEIVNKAVNKSAVGWLPGENFTASFIHDFAGILNTDNKNKWLNVIIGNYSDKNTILAKKIALGAMHNGKAIIGGSGAVLSLDEISELIYNQQGNFYSDTYKSVVTKYNKIFPNLKLSDNITHWNDTYTRVNAEFEKLTKEEFLDKAQEAGVDTTAELDYSSYDKKLGLNQNLFDYFAFYSDKRKFKEYMEKELDNLVFDVLNFKKGDNSKFLITDSELGTLLQGRTLKEFFEFFGVTEEEIKPFIREGSEIHESIEGEEDVTVPLVNILVKDEKGNVNPMLKRWMMVNMLFRNEYLNITIKHEYMHSAKNLAKRSAADIGNVQKYLIEASPRYSGMAKRNVALTSTYEVGIQNSRFGQPKKVNYAIISDPNVRLYNISGDTQKVDHQDGSSSINYLYSKMISKSYPGKEYNGTLKRFGTFITDYGSAIKKDAEVVINNASIRFSPNKGISHLNLQRKMLSSHDINITSFKQSLTSEYFFNENGRFYRLINFSIVNNILNREVQEYTAKGEAIPNSKRLLDPIKIKNLFNIWEAFGAQYSGKFSGGKIKYDEGSNDLLFDVITTYKENGEYILKDKFIHGISNESTFKSGAVNLNSVDRWTDDKELRFATFESAHMGPQLDPGHSADESKIKEIIQVISGLSQNERTAELANEVYDDLARMIKESAKSYLKTINNINDKQLTELYSSLSKEFIRHVANSPGVDLATIIAETFREGEIIPFSNKNFFQKFVKDLIVKLNTEFITRYYSGLGAVLNPSHNIIQVYHTTNPDGTELMYTHEDLIKLALNNFNPSNFINKEDKIVFGHPGIGKTFLHKAGIQGIIDFDSEYKDRINKELGLPEGDAGLAVRQAYRKEHKEEYNQKVRDLWNQAKQDAASSNRQLFASDMIILREFAQDFDRFITMTPESFIEKSHQRGEFDDNNKLLWKQDIDNALSTVDPSKILTTDKYLSELIIQNNENIVQNYIRENLPDIPTSRDRIQLMDNVKETPDGPIISLDSPEEYYKFKNTKKFFDDTNEENNIVYKVQSVPRDLKPQETTFEVTEIKDLTLAKSKKAVIFQDLDLSKTEITKLKIEQQLLPAGQDSYYDPNTGKIVLNSTITNAETKKFLILHEFIGHHGLYNLFKDEDKLIYKNVLLSAKNYLFDNAATLIDRSKFSTLDEFITAYGFDLTTEEGELNLIEELLARQAEQNDQLNWFQKIAGRLQLIYAKLFGLDRPMSREGVIELLLMAKKAALHNTGFSEQLTEDKKYFPVHKSKNLFDFDSVKWQYDLLQDNITSELKQFGAHFLVFLDDEDIKAYNKTVAKDQPKYPLLDEKLLKANKAKISQYLRAWTQRNLELLDENIVMKSIESVQQLDGIIDFDLYFGDDTLVADIYDDVKDHYKQKNSLQVYNYQFKGAELILPNIYKTTFNTGDDTISEIKTRGVAYFEERLAEQYNVDDTKADLRIDLNSGKKVYVKFVTQWPIERQNENMFIEDSKNGMPVKYRVVESGEKLYILPPNSRMIVDDDNNDVIYVRVADFSPLQGANILRDSNKNLTVLRDLLKSFKTINAIVPIMNDTEEMTVYNNSEKTFDSVNLRRLIIDQFSDFFKVNFLSKNIDSNWYMNNRLEIISKLAGKRYASWEKSHEFVAARIPAQSMQSFMPMTNVGYFNTSSNDAYVSVWQIWLQGSDFDVDKAYIMGYGFGNGAQLDISTNLFDYSSKQELNAIEKLPIPTGQKIVVENSNDMYNPEEDLKWFARIDQGDNAELTKTMSFETAKNMTIDDIITLGKVLRRISKYKTMANLSSHPNFGSFVNFINFYNNYRGYLYTNYSLQNSVVGKIKNIISSPSNQILSSIPISTQQLHDGAAAATIETLSMISKVINDWVNKKELPKPEIVSDVAITTEVIVSLNEQLKQNPTATLDNKVLTAKDVANIEKWFVSKKSPLKALIASLTDVNIEAITDKDISSLRKGVKYNTALIMNFIEELLAKKARFSSSNGTGMFKQQYQAAVGKKDVGIGANGLKVFFALSSYYNDWYRELESNKIDISIENVGDPKIFLKQFYVNHKDYNKVSIADTRVSRESFRKILNLYGYTEQIDELAKLNKIQAALAISGFVSGATDNAKELIMAKINAVVSLASMHLYMMALGFTSTDISLYMNSDLAKYVSNNIENNTFETAEGEDRVPDLVKSYFERPGIEAMYDSIEEAEKIKSTFLDIYDGAQEFKMLSSIFAVNGTISAEPKELNKFLNTLEKSMYAGEVKTFKEDTLNKMKLIKNGEPDEKVKDTIIDNILKRNSSLKKLAETNLRKLKEGEQYTDEELSRITQSEAVKKYIWDTLVQASNVKVSYINFYGEEETKMVSVIGGEFDSRYYMFPKNEEYRKLASNYYNLIKNTVNVFDVLENVPHFREMSNSVGIIFNIALLTSKKFNFVFSYLRDLYKEETAFIQYGSDKKDVVKHIFGNSAFPLDITDKIIDRALNTFDNYLIAGWLKSSTDPKVVELKFSVQDLLKKAKVDKITLNDNDGAKNYSPEEIRLGEKGKVAEFTRTVHIDKGEDTIIDLTTDTGIANFKIVMEKLMFQMLEDSEKSELGKQLSLRNIKDSFGLFSTKITPTYGLGQMNNPVSIENFIRLLNEFNKIDSVIEANTEDGKPNYQIKNTKGKVIKWGDLLYLYNLVVNNETYGNLRLTPLFEDYVKDTGNLGRSYLNYCAKVDMARRGDQEDLFSIDNTVNPELRNSLVAEQKNNIMFLTLHRGGKLIIGSHTMIIDGKKHKIPDATLVMKNGNYPVNTTQAKRTANEGINYRLMQSIMSQMLSQNLIINYNCE